MKNNKNNKNEHNHTETEEGICLKCQEKEYLKEEGISNDGVEINPDYMTDEDVIFRLEVKKEITIPVDIRVHKDHKEHFDVSHFIHSDEIQEYINCVPPHELLDESTEYHRVVCCHKITGDKVKDDFYQYVCCDGTFYSRPVDEEVVEIPKLLN